MAESKPRTQSNREFAAGLEKVCSCLNLTDLEHFCKEEWRKLQSPEVQTYPQRFSAVVEGRLAKTDLKGFVSVVFCRSGLVRVIV